MDALWKRCPGNIFHPPCVGIANFFSFAATFLGVIVMRIVLLLLGSFILGCFLSYCSSLLLAWLARRKAPLPERVRVSSIEDANRLRGKRVFSPDEKFRLWADAMNILMTEESKDVARRYVNEAIQALGEGGNEFRIRATEIFKNRYGCEL